MNPVGAISLMVKHHPGGWEVMGQKCGKSGETLRHAFSGKDSRYVPSVVDACIISETCIEDDSPHCRAFVNAINVNCGGFVRLSVLDTMSADGLHVDLASVVKEAADFLTAGTAGLADGHISDNDYKEASRELQELLAAVQQAQQRLDVAHKDGKLRLA
jgi:hypothetical protein